MALAVERVGELHIRRLLVENPGIGIDVNADDAAEHFYDEVVIESPAQVGFQVRRTRAVDIGGLYLHWVKVTNPGGRSGRGFVFQSSVPNTALPIFLETVIADGFTEGDSASFANINLIRCVSSWFTNAGPALRQLAALKLTNVTEAWFVASHFQSQSRDVALLGTIRSVRFSLAKFGGATNIYLDRTGQKGGIDIVNPVTSWTPRVTSNDPVFLTSLGSVPASNQLAATAKLAFDAWGGNDCQTRTVTVKGIADTDVVSVGLPHALASMPDISWSWWVSAADAVSIRGCKVNVGPTAQPPTAVVRVFVTAAR